MRNSLWRFVSALGVIGVCALASYAERLPVKQYTVADGLPHNHINRIWRDSRGYLWVCTDEGLARYDGYGFVTYGTAQGLLNLTINDFIETRSGKYWVATDGGVCLFNPLGKTSLMFKVYRVGEREETNHVNSLLEDLDGSLWLATSGGLFRLRQTNGQAQIEEVDPGFPTGTRDDRHVTKLFFDSHGALWIASISGLYRRWPDGRTERFSRENGFLNNFIQSVFEDQHRRLWVGSRGNGLYLLVANPQPGQRIVEKLYSSGNGLPGNDVRNITPLSDGRAWLCIVGGLVLFDPQTDDNRKFTSYTPSQGLATEEIYNLTHDIAGNMWVGTRNSGVMRIAAAGFTTFGVADGFTPAIHNTMLESDNGELVIYNGSNTLKRFLYYFDGSKFTGLDYQVAHSYGFGQRQAILQDHTGEWWIATDDGLYRYSRLSRIADAARTRPTAIYTTREGLAQNPIERIYEDQRGDIWFSTYLNTQTLNSLHRWERSTNKIHQYTLPESTAPKININVLGEDGQGNLWIGFHSTGAMTRYRNGHFKLFTMANGAPASSINSFFLDSRKRFWIATKENGLHRVEEATDNQLRLTTWDVSKGFSSNEIWSITEDQWGRIYAGTGRGIDRLDPATGVVRHFDSDDGLVPGEVRVSLRDHDNQLWFVTEHGISRLEPTLDAAPFPMSVLIQGIRLNGAPITMSDLGEARIENLTLAPEQTWLQIDFASIDFNAGSGLRYQYQLNEDPWTVASDSRMATFTHLSPGTYRFSVRAINSFGLVNPSPAIVNFTILRPVWQRWWFLVVLAMCLGGLVYAGYRYRLGQAVKVERVRTRIAHDLHDDIGANLTRISILSEVAKQQSNGEPSLGELSAGLLDSIADISRESVAAMNDIVWAINPEHDSLLDLTSRMRRHAEEVFTTRDIRLNFEAPDNAEQLKLDIETRRDLYLIFKEAVNNAARHADCSAVSIRVQTSATHIQLSVVDDGKGFDPTALAEGNGLLSMRNRAQTMKGTLKIESSFGKGAELSLIVPVSPA